MAESFADRLSKVMRDNGLSRRKLAALARVKPPTVTGWLSGSLPYPKTVTVICIGLGVSKRWLLAGEGRPYLDVHKARSKEAFAEFWNEFEEVRDPAIALIEEYQRLAHESAARAVLYFERADALLESVKKSARSRIEKDFHSDVPMASQDKQLTHTATLLQEEAMRNRPALINPSLEELLDAVRKKTDVKGGRRALADFMGVTESRLSKWLSSRSDGVKYLPSAANAYKLLTWVNGEPDAQLKKNPAGVTAPTGPLTQRRSSNDEKTTSSRQKVSRKPRKFTTEKH